MAKWIVNNIEKIGIELARGVLDYLGIKYVPVSAPTKGRTLYRVVTGSYAVKDNAKAQMKRLKKEGFDMKNVHLTGLSLVQYR